MAAAAVNIAMETRTDLQGKRNLKKSLVHFLLHLNLEKKKTFERLSVREALTKTCKQTKQTGFSSSLE